MTVYRVFKLTYPDGTAYIGLTLNDRANAAGMDEKHFAGGRRPFGCPLQEILFEGLPAEAKKKRLFAIREHGTEYPTGYNRPIEIEKLRSRAGSVPNLPEKATYSKHSKAARTYLKAINKPHSPRPAIEICAICTHWPSCKLENRCLRGER